MINFNEQSVSAASQTSLGTVLSNNPNSSDGVDRTVPDGLSNITTWFNVPNIANNNTQILTPGVGENKSNADVIKLTQYGSTYPVVVKIGAIWAKRDQTEVDNRNYIDINKKQTMSMWMFFGGVAGLSGAKDTGDGMAFVLQNDNDSTFTSIPKGGFKGESLGVWGSETSVKDSSSTLANLAIQNSWALEFDTHPNYHDGAGNNFDDYPGVGYTTNHIAANYPADPATYLVGSSNGAQMVHLNPYSTVSGATYPKNFLTDDRWHHVTMTWNPATNSSPTVATINLKYDDKTIDGISKTPTINQDYPIKLDEFNLGSSNQLYWGFTGSTGSDTENNLVIFESIPAIVEAEANSTMYDETSDRYIDDVTTEDPNRNVVYDGDKVDINYNLSYSSGSKPWNNIVADIKLPDKIDYDSALITYKDTTGKETAESMDEFSGMTNNEVKHQLAQALWKNNIVSAKITFKGTVNSGSDTVDTNVASAHSSFDGTDLQKDVMTKPFVIKHIANVKLEAVDNTNVDALLGQPVNLKGKVSYSDNTTVTPSNMEIHARLDDSSDEMAISDMSANPFTFNLSGSELTTGKHKLVLYVVDKTTHKASNEITFNINVVASLQLTVAKTSTFRTVQALPYDKLIKRANDWQVMVTDTRANGSKWNLSAEATPLSDDWKGGIVYVDKTSNAEEPITDNLTNIASGTKTSETPTSVSSDWTDNTGLLLRQTGQVESGVHSSTVTWTVVDSTNK
ncbi:lectin-like domain-containing protein [Companilactobacillus kimchiensis]|nr:hypothetical protein [Companilactobacillus kimchiensis]